MRYGIIIDDTETRYIKNKGGVSKEDIKKEVEKCITELFGNIPASMVTPMDNTPQFFGMIGASDDQYKVYTVVAEGTYKRVAIKDDQGGYHSPSFIISSSVNGYLKGIFDMCLPNLTNMTYLELVNAIAIVQGGIAEVTRLLRKDVDKDIWNEKCFSLECQPNEHEGYMTVTIKHNSMLDDCSLLPHISSYESFEDFYKNNLRIYTMLNVACKE